MTNDPTIRDAQVLAFARDARAFCDFIDRLIDQRPPRCYTDLLRLLSNLADTGFDLPFAMPDREVAKTTDGTMDMYARVGRAIANAISPEKASLIEHHAEDNDELTRVVMLYDDLRDIYRDLIEGLRLFDEDTTDARAEAVWQWRFGYESHWGRHLMRALSTVHEIRFFLVVE